MSDNVDSTADLGDSEISSVQHSCGEPITKLLNAPDEGSKIPAAGILLPSSGAFKSLVMGSPHECWTLDISESPKSAVESTLSDILETGDLPPQCFLSPAACQGVLNRSVDKRYKVKLSPRLRAALEKVSSRSTTKKDETSQSVKESQTP